MASTGFSPPPQWSWPQNIPGQPGLSRSSPMPGSFENESSPPVQEPANEKYKAAPAADVKQEKEEQVPDSEQRSRPEQKKKWPPRKCRICLEVVHPTFETPSEHLPNIFQGSPRASYISDDPQDGRLLCPCKCKGSSKYVHEGCLQAWRHADPNSKRNYWQCPTCHFEYRLERIAWSRWISSGVAQIGLTLVIFVFAMFLLGFVADPIINLYLDPFSAFSSDPLSGINHKIENSLSEDDIPTWTEHFAKGLASLGLLGLAKFFFSIRAWHWNLRSGVRGGTGGRDRLANLSWVMILIGVATFLWGVYKGVRAWSRRTLENAGSRVMDVDGGDDDDEEE